MTPGSPLCGGVGNNPGAPLTPLTAFGAPLPPAPSPPPAPAPSPPPAPAVPTAAPSGDRWAWTGAVAPHVPVALSGLLMLAVLASTWKADTAETTNWVRALMGWAWRHAQPLAVGIFLLSVAYTYTPWREVGQTFQRKAAGGWSWRVIGCYLAGLAAGAATLILCLEIGGDSKWMMWVGVLDMVVVVTLFALAAHWNPQWEAPPALVGVWAGGFMLLVPGWLALCNLASKF